MPIDKRNLKKCYIRRSTTGYIWYLYDAKDNLIARGPVCASIPQCVGKFNGLRKTMQSPKDIPIITPNFKGAKL